MSQRPLARPESVPADVRRQGAVDALHILDSLPEQTYDDLVRLARRICGTSMALVSLIDHDRQWFKARIGMSDEETPLSYSFCRHAIQTPEHIFVVPDARRDPRFADNPYVVGAPHIRFYAGMPLLSPDGVAVGTVCVLDSESVVLGEDQLESLRALARQAGRMLELQQKSLQLQRYLTERDYLAGRMQEYQRELERRNRELHELATHDGLTGLLNRGALDRMRADADDAARLFGEPYSVAMIDIDHFKRINDEHGHAMGDDALRQVAAVIADCVRGRDIAGRYGGEEFLVLMPATPMIGARTVVERVRLGVQALALPFPVRLSIGLASGRPGEDDPQQVIERADQALYRAKRNGRDRVVASED